MTNNSRSWLEEGKGGRRRKSPNGVVDEGEGLKNPPSVVNAIRKKHKNEEGKEAGV